MKGSANISQQANNPGRWIIKNPANKKLLLLQKCLTHRPTHAFTCQNV